MSVYKTERSRTQRIIKMETLDFECEARFNGRPFKPENTLLMVPGPTNVSPRVAQALANTTMASVNTDELYDLMDNIQKMARYVFQTKNQFTFLSQTSGNGANEIMISNLTDPGDTVLMVAGGFWGERLVAIAERQRLNIVVMKSKQADVYSLSEFEEELKKHKPVALFLTHGETAAGQLQSLEGLGDLCHKYNCLLGVDAVITVAALPVLTDRWKLDAVITAGQKGIGAPAGLSLLTFNSAALKKMQAKKVRPPFYLDAISLGKFFNCFPGGRSYVYTYNSHMLCALHEALAEVCEEGLENRWRRHRDCSQMLMDGLTELGFSFPLRKEIRLNDVVIAKPPKDVSFPALFRDLKERHKIDVGFGIGVSQNCFRIGVMGYNAQPSVIRYFLEAMKESMEYVRNNPQNDVEEIVFKSS